MRPINLKMYYKKTYAKIQNDPQGPFLLINL